MVRFVIASLLLIGLSIAGYFIFQKKKDKGHWPVFYEAMILRTKQISLIKDSSGVIAKPGDTITVMVFKRQQDTLYQRVGGSLKVVPSKSEMSFEMVKAVVK